MKLLDKEVHASHRTLAIRPSKIHGYGVFASTPFKRGDFIASIQGSKVMYQSHFKGQSNRYSDWIGHGQDRWIDPVDEFQYINHSCNPSAGIKGNGELKVYAMRDIEPGEEITIDYSTTEADEAFEFENCEPVHDKFRKVIGPIQTLPVETYNSYLPFIPNYFQKVYRDKVLSRNGKKRAPH